ncbi:YdcF family protein [Pseudohalioglobus sediminis]|uniref:YdcF family protein n=1 Tax=Pseudohalioglobus sediminis TaxID=2606449 RepID=A0A5B0WST3_9GAMM|nr:YdcF family protein [Pseudohalioglobus sediminis]KAA1188909.1 YdcF family protein [Pseudohalioglobus sediminis]
MTKLLSLLVYPLSQGLLLGLLALLCWRWRRLSAGLLLCALAWLYACSTALVADALLGPLEDAYRPKAMSVLPVADAIVVLGGASRGDTHLGSMADLNAQADRLTHAVALYRAGKAPRVLLSGGAAEGGRPEAEQMADHLVLMGVPPRALLQENQSRDTRQNAQYSARLLAEQGATSIHLVSSAFHLRRAVPLFAQQGLTVIPAPTDFQRQVAEPSVPRWLPTVDDLARSTWAIREYVGYLYYRYRGWI